MSGDYSRRRFNPQKHYQGVLRQQGRVDLDADWNEYVDIQDRRWRAETIDVVGQCGVPSETPDGFKVGMSEGFLTVGPGRIYVDGYLVENHGDNFEFDPTIEENYGAEAATTATKAPSQRALVYLDVWQREVTPLQAPDLIEPAVNVDTTTRHQTAWQVRVLENIDQDVTCDTPLNQIKRWQSTHQPSGARLSTGTVEVPHEANPCLVPPTSGYRGLENHLYRVEVHSVSASGIKVKWSRDNAHVGASVSEVRPDRLGLRVESLGRDDVLRFETDDWVEITNDRLEFAGRSGEMRKVTVDNTTREMTFTPALPASDFSIGRPRADDHVRVIRWNQAKIVRKPDGTELVNLDSTSDGLITLSRTDPSFVLEHGIQITLSVGAARPGDYWCFAARTAEADIERLTNAPPHGIHHHYCKLAIIESRDRVHDCRPRYPALTELTSLFYVSGDGQEGSLGGPLPRPIQVGVANGQYPVVDAMVRFRIISGNGSLNDGSVGEAGIIVRTDDHGIASCDWTLGSDLQSQQVEATLADGTHLPVRFNATLIQHEPGIRVERIRIAGNEVINDSEVPVAELAMSGIRVSFSDPIHIESIRDKPVCLVTLMVPFLNEGGELIGYTPLVLAADDIGGTNRFVEWKPVARFQNFSEELFKTGSVKRILAYLTLKGNFIWGENDPSVYLDGEVFGWQDMETVEPPVTHVRFPSGDGHRGGDLEMWFWLVPSNPSPAPLGAGGAPRVAKPSSTRKPRRRSSPSGE